jgi:hypothetical protein
LAPVILPANSVPVQCTKTWNTIDIQVQRSIIHSATRLHPTLTAGFLQNLSPWQSQLLHQLASEHSHHAILTMLEDAEKTLIIALDGSVRQNINRGTFAWILAAADGTLWLKCKGPVGGFQVDSFRAEGYGLLLAVLYLNLLT